MPLLANCRATQRRARVLSRGARARAPPMRVNSILVNKSWTSSVGSAAIVLRAPDEATAMQPGAGGYSRKYGQCLDGAQQKPGTARSRPEHHQQVIY